MANPFAHLSVGDVARDVGALIFLFGSLALPWDALNDGSGRWWVVLSVVISAVSLAFPYLSAAHVIPGWGGHHVTMAKAAAQAPYALSAVVLLVNELIHLTSSSEGGLGASLTVGLAGVVLAVQPRAVELPAVTGDAAPTPPASPWLRVSVALIAVGAGLYALTTVIFFVKNVSDYSGTTLISLLGAIVFVVVTYVVAVTFTLGGYLRQSAASGRVLAVVGVTVVVVTFLANAGDSGSGTLFYSVPVGRLSGDFGSFGAYLSPAGEFLVAAGAMIVVSTPVIRSRHWADHVGSWVQTVTLAFTGVALLLGLSAIANLMVAIGSSDYSPGVIAPIVIMLVAVAAALVGRTLAHSDADNNRVALLAIAGGIILVSVVAIAVGRSGDQGSYPVVPAEAAAWFALPGLVIFSLLVPTPVRTTFRPIAVGTPPTQVPPAG